MKIKNFSKIFFIIVLISLVISGCGSKNGSSLNGQAVLVVTKNYGKDVIFDKKVKIDKNYTVMDILEENLQVGTKWGGDFVSEINGIKSDNGGVSGKRQDWFYFVNGVCADTGASEYEVKSQDIVWWDYHPWENMNSANSAVIGCFPEPFIHGYRNKPNKVIIMASTDNLDLANSLKDSILSKGAENIEVKKLDENLIKDRLGPTIVIGQWDEIKKLNYINNLNEEYKKSGINVHFKDEKIELLKYDGTAVKKIKENAGVITAVGEGLGDDKPLWLIVGIDSKGLDKAVNLLVNNPEKIKNMYSAVVTSEEIISLPIQ
ncbi:protein of unknown function [Caminicella sporogenes DSM 14501]|uniref:Transcobalamin-like C-terminal domain-containing protein n=1 Tax=Caminicella sporogenes DSM 14501 TaxID=1121266 RepID=A0A1M6PDS1_9FIRM|nr:DUF4430 domain-containing protein [Caminicella sporogenes]RKD21439.1 hypothetical protein BET04_08350 [Caminicella sporogenes]WIF95420.1 DUF4430 domain-containing protein [Caminicella sporogenes]SHK06030.1 protein of unknown function [Caminicella sporogenes DSM 14501]